MDDIGLIIECDDLEEGTTRFERIVRDTMQWGADNKVELEVSKTEVLLFSRRKKFFQAASAKIDGRNIFLGEGLRLEGVCKSAPTSA